MKIHSEFVEIRKICASSISCPPVQMSRPRRGRVPHPEQLNVYDSEKARLEEMVDNLMKREKEGESLMFFSWCVQKNRVDFASRLL